MFQPSQLRSITLVRFQDSYSPILKKQLSRKEKMSNILSHQVSTLRSSDLLSQSRGSAP